jgi:hypothetical protein
MPIYVKEKANYSLGKRANLNPIEYVKSGSSSDRPSQVIFNLSEEYADPVTHFDCCSLNAGKSWFILPE